MYCVLCTVYCVLCTVYCVGRASVPRPVVQDIGFTATVCKKSSVDLFAKLSEIEYYRRTFVICMCFMVRSPPCVRVYVCVCVLAYVLGSQERRRAAWCWWCRHMRGGYIASMVLLLTWARLGGIPRVDGVPPLWRQYGVDGAAVGHWVDSGHAGGVGTMHACALLVWAPCAFGGVQGSLAPLLYHGKQWPLLRPVGSRPSCAALTPHRCRTCY